MPAQISPVRALSSAGPARLGAILLLGLFLLVQAACGGGGRQIRVEARAEAPQATADRLVRRAALRRVVAPTDGPARSLAEIPFDRAWDLQLPAPVHTMWISDRVNELLFVQTQDGVVHGIESGSGMTRWVSQPLPALIEHETHVHRVARRDAGQRWHDDRLYLIADDELFVLDCAYGQLIWRYHLGRAGSEGFQPATGPFANGSDATLRIFIGDWEGRMRVIAHHEEHQRGYLRWQWNLQAVPGARASGHEDMTYVGDNAGVLSSFGLERERLWDYNAGGALLGRPLLRGRAVYVGSDDNILHAVNRLTGEGMGRLYLGAPVRRGPMSFTSEPERIYVWTDGRPEGTGLRAIRAIDDNIVLEDVQADYERRIEAQRMQEDWFLPGVTRLVASSPHHLYLMRPESTVVLAVDRRDGRIDYHWDLAAEAKGRRAPVMVAEYLDPANALRMVVAADEAGRLQAYRLFGSDAPQAKR